MDVIQFNKSAFLLSGVLLAVLVYIALFVHDSFIRPFLGDVLVVIWLFVFLKSFLSFSSPKLAHLVLIFSCLIEIAQFFKLVELLGLQEFKLARVVIGTTFDWLDLLAYGIGWVSILISLIVTRLIRERNLKSSQKTKDV